MLQLKKKSKVYLPRYFGCNINASIYNSISNCFHLLLKILMHALRNDICRVSGKSLIAAKSLIISIKQSAKVVVLNSRHFNAFLIGSITDTNSSKST